MLLYLAAIVTANLLVTRFGPMALPISSFFLLPFDLCTRDILHERWHGRRLALKMSLLVIAGSAVSYVLTASAARVAMASMLAFGTAATIDTGVYAATRQLTRFQRMNLSNLCAAIADSVIFPIVAFGSTTFLLSVTQSASKFFGGIIWSALFVVVVRQSYLRREVNRLRSAICKHRDARGNERCWENDLELYAALAEPVPVSPELPVREVFLRNCERYYDEQTALPRRPYSAQDNHSFEDNRCPYAASLEDIKEKAG